MLELTAIKVLKENWKVFLFALLVVAVVILWMLLQSETRRANENQAGRDAAIQTSKGLSVEVGKYRNKLGDTVTVLKSIMVPKSQVNSLLEENNLQWLKKFEGLKKNGSNLQSAETFSVQLEDQKIPEKPVYLPCKDSIKATSFDLVDAWNNIHAQVIGTPIIEIKDRYYAAIELRRPKAWFWKLQWSKRDPYLEITNSNKLINVDSVVSIVVK